MAYVSQAPPLLEHDVYGKCARPDGSEGGLSLHATEPVKQSSEKSCKAQWCILGRL